MKWYLKVLQKYANFEGRSRRREYWMYFIFNVLISYGLQILAVATDTPVLMFLFVVYALGLLIPSLAVGVRRMHDVGKSGWYLLVPFYNLILACTEGDHLDNQYGRNPKALEETALQNV
ncbi:DUF805 domain-containing protein [Pareuzebyella sediminis]|uniref:DUF805 domain-containing protein n=1 Tax=Pareuzebyella sediminis TaxID=2607998 RepID=UPI0011EC6CC1|nr:DUF805 domain-containing protein [Pareuzebyella sediminis]